MKKRINNLEFKPASYLLPKNKWPDHPAWDIVKWYPNEYYNKQDEFIPIKGDPKFYQHPEFTFCKVHKDCFKYPETCYSIATFEYDEHENFYELHFVCDRPLDLNEDEIKTFWELIKFGNTYLNDTNRNRNNE